MSQRKQLMVSWAVQGPLLVRLVTHLVTFAAALISLIMLCWLFQRGAIEKAFGAGNEPIGNFWYRFLPFAASALALLPFIIYDMLKITNRIAGPLYRFEVLMKEFEDTGVLQQAKLRENDLLNGFCERFNSFAEVMHERYPECVPLESAPAEATTSEAVGCQQEEPVLV